MDRQIPDIWNIFSIGGPDYSNKHNTINNQFNQFSPAVAGAADGGGIHVNWSSRNQDLLNKWTDRSSPCDRPRTYDKFYQKLPGNFVDPTNSDNRGCVKSLCTSSETELEDESELLNDESSSNRKKRRKKKGDRHYSRTITGEQKRVNPDRNNF
jgi:hypothetical protein